MGWVGGPLPMCKEKETEIAGVQQKKGSKAKTTLGPYAADERLL
jgi:hypothetical protein